MSVFAVVHVITALLLVLALALLTRATDRLRDSIQRYVHAVRDHNQIELLDPPPTMMVYTFVALGFVVGFILGRALP